jgi:hypothetical protein
MMRYAFVSSESAKYDDGISCPNFLLYLRERTNGKLPSILEKSVLPQIYILHGKMLYTFLRKLHLVACFSIYSTSANKVAKNFISFL